MYERLCFVARYYISTMTLVDSTDASHLILFIVVMLLNTYSLYDAHPLSFIVLRVYINTFLRYDDDSVMKLAVNIHQHSFVSFSLSSYWRRLSSSSIEVLSSVYIYNIYSVYNLYILDFILVIRIYTVQHTSSTTRIHAQRTAYIIRYIYIYIYLKTNTQQHILFVLVKLNRFTIRRDFEHI